MSHFNPDWNPADCSEKGKALVAVEKETNLTDSLRFHGELCQSLFVHQTY